MQTSVDPARVKTLRDWVARWPKAANLRFDPTTREPTIYARDAPTSVVGVIPWKREGDTMTILAEPDRASEAAVAAAQKRYDEYHDATRLAKAAIDSELRTAEAALLAAWRAYETRTPDMNVSTLKMDIFTSEQRMRTLEEDRAGMREIRPFGARGSGIYVEPLPIGRRGLAIAEITGGSL